MAVRIESAATVGIPSSIGSVGFPRVGVTVHYIGESAVNRGSHSQCRAQVRGWHSYHRSIGWAGIGYNWLICHHGIVLTGRGLRRIGAHNRVANSTYQGVCFMLGGSQQPNAAMLKAFRDLLAWMRNQGVSAGYANVRGHRDHIATTCPGNHLYSRVRNRNWGSGGSTPAPPTPAPPPVIEESPKVLTSRDMRYYGGRQEVPANGDPLNPSHWRTVDFTGGQYRTASGGWEEGTGTLLSIAIHGSGHSGINKTTVELTLDGMRKGDEMQVRFYTVVQQNGNWVREFTYAPHSINVGGMHLNSMTMKRMGANKRLRVEVLNRGPESVYITRARTDSVTLSR